MTADNAACQVIQTVILYGLQVKGENPPAPTRGLSKRSAGGTDAGDDADDDVDVHDGATAAGDLVPRTDIRFAVSTMYVLLTLKLTLQCFVIYLQLTFY